MNAKPTHGAALVAFVALVTLVACEPSSPAPATSTPEPAETPARRLDASAGDAAAPLADAATDAPGATDADAPWDEAAFLAQWAPLSAGEGAPHGVPSDWSWALHATEATLTAPAGTGNMNWWGEVYVDTSDVRPPNTRVEIAGGKLLVLYDGASTWETHQATNDLGGGAWAENFQPGTAPLDMRSEPSGTRSFATVEGNNAHFWPNLGFQPIVRPVRAVVSLAFARLILRDANAPDDRAQSKYLVSMGADWRSGDGACPNGVCTGVGQGRFVYARAEWRAVVMSTTTASDVASLPLPPSDAFRMPDGNLPN